MRWLYSDFSALLCAWFTTEPLTRHAEKFKSLIYSLCINVIKLDYNWTDTETNPIFLSLVFPILLTSLRSPTSSLVIISDFASVYSK